MPIIDALSSLTELQHGLVTTSQARRLLGANATRQLDRSAEWTRVTPTVRRRVGAPQTKGQAALAAVLDAGGDALLSHESAARWGLTGCPLWPVTITTTKSGRRTELAVTHKITRLPQSWTAKLRGIPIVRPELLALQLFSVTHEDRASRLVDRLWSMRLLSGPSIVVFLDDLGERGRNGTAGLRRYLEPRGADYIPPASGLESRVTAILDRVGIHLRRQIDSGGDRWTGRVDFRHVTLPLIVEVQSEAFHAALCDSDADERRIAELRSAGFVVVEVTDTDAWTVPGIVVEKVSAGLDLSRSLVWIAP